MSTPQDTASKSKRTELLKMMPDLPMFQDMLHIAANLPHPASSGVVRMETMLHASSLSIVTLQIIEMIMGTICQRAKTNSLSGVSTIRCTEKASKVNILRDSKSKDAVRVESTMGRHIKDKAIENAEYISVFGLGSFDQFSSINPSQLFFRDTFEVRPTQDTIFAQARVHNGVCY